MAAPMRILVACEFSARVRDAFRARGHDAWSCDLEPTEGSTQYHYQEDVRALLARDARWDALIAFPDCTYLTVTANRWMREQPDRREKMLEAVAFVKWLAALPIPKIAIENPRGRLSTLWRKSDQRVHPYQFGHAHVSKETHLWLKGLPLLVPTDVRPSVSFAPAIHYAPESASRKKDRSRTYEGIARAMASQWSPLVGVDA